LKKTNGRGFKIFRQKGGVLYGFYFFFI